MKDEIKVGDYIRTKSGSIDKVINNEYYMPQYIECEHVLIRIEEIVNYNSNIIDLTEEGDILKVKEGKLIFYVGIEKDDEELTHKEIIDTIKNKEVELLSIVTHEQFKNIEYKL